MRSTPTAAPEALLGIGPLQKSICEQPAKTHYRIKDVHGVKLVKGTEPKKLRHEGILVVPSDSSDRPA